MIMYGYEYAFEARDNRAHIIDIYRVTSAGKRWHAGNANLMRAYLDGTALWNIFADARTYSAFISDDGTASGLEWSTLARSCAGDAAVHQLAAWLAQD